MGLLDSCREVWMGSAIGTFAGSATFTFVYMMNEIGRVVPDDECCKDAFEEYNCTMPMKGLYDLPCQPQYVTDDTCPSNISCNEYDSPETMNSALVFKVLAAAGVAIGTAIGCKIRKDRLSQTGEGTEITTSEPYRTFP